MFSIIKQSTSLAPVGTPAARTFIASAIQLKKRDPSIPVAPKRPSSAYGVFIKDWYPSNKAELIGPEGKFNMKTVSKAMSTAWNALTDTDKKPFEDRQKDMWKAWETEYKKWYNALDPATIKAIEESTGKKLAPPGGKKGVRLEKSSRPGNPGQPLTAFFEFLKEYRSGEGQGKSVTEVATSAGDKWRQMSEDDKKKYRDSAAESKAKYVEWQKTLQ